MFSHFSLHSCWFVLLYFSRSHWFFLFIFCQRIILSANLCTRTSFFKFAGLCAATSRRGKTTNSFFGCTCYFIFSISHFIFSSLCSFLSSTCYFVFSAHYFFLNLICYISHFV